MFLRALGDGYLARDNNGDLYKYTDKPKWCDFLCDYSSAGMDEMGILINSDIFKFINKGECYSFLVQPSGKITIKNVTPIVNE